MKKITAKRLSDALSLLSMSYIEDGDIPTAAHIHTVANTLRADPKTLAKLAKVLDGVLRK